MAAALQDPSRTVVLAVGAKETSDTILLWRYCNAHILEHETDKVIVVHVRSASALPTSWAPLNMALSFSADEAGWLPEEMRMGLKRCPTAEYWELKSDQGPSSAIAEWLARHPADLLIVGCRGVSRMRSAVLGSTSKAILAACTSVATLVVRAPLFVAEVGPVKIATSAGQELAEPAVSPSFLPHNARAIALCLDGSDASGVLLGWSLGHLLRPEDSIVILHSSSTDDFAEITASGQLAACSAELHKFLSDASQLRTVRLPSGSGEGCADALCRAIESEGPFDLAICGSRGLSTLRRLGQRLRGRGGSVSSHLVDYAGCPVLVCPRDALLAWLNSDLGGVTTPETSPRRKAMMGGGKGEHAGESGGGPETPTAPKAARRHAAETAEASE